MRAQTHTQARRFIQDRATGMFLTANGEWTSDLAEAASWPSLSMMNEPCARFGLTNVDAVLRLNLEDPWQRVLPLA